MNYLDKQIDNDLEREEHEQRRADRLGGVHKGGGQVDAVKVLVRRIELLAQLDGIGKVEAAESADEHVADEPGDVLELLRQALHKNVKAEVLLMTDDDGEIEHQHPDIRMLIQLQAILKFKFEESERQHKDIGESASMKWFESGLAKRFAEVYNEELSFKEIYKKVMEKYNPISGCVES